MKTFKPGEPKGDATRHLPSSALEAAHASRTASPFDEGWVSLIVRRLEDGRRESLPRIGLSLEEGVPGDDWSRRPPRDPAAQLAVMQTSIAAIIANGQPLTTFGDNLFVELDLSAGNLPTGSLLAVGAATVEVTPKPHNGCSKFDVRFGNDALRFVQAKETRHENRRGIYWRVVTPGEVAVGDPVRVLRRGSA
ncbi:MOSC domain-containing protein [Myxococcota bacterium]|nr:MOSC domain-containing protein [Myxococcota bacterium]